jgi:hypothetical protein
MITNGEEEMAPEQVKLVQVSFAKSRPLRLPDLAKMGKGKESVRGNTLRRD